MTSPQEFKTLLDSFETPDDLAGYLHRKEFKGYQIEVAGYPLANLAKSMGLVSVYVGPNHIGSNSYSLETWCFVPTEVTKAFIMGFDSGRYPELVAA